jgi:RNA polymerase sigma-70 factor (ECF subfamily)
MAPRAAPSDDENVLLAQTARRNAEAFAALYDRYGGPVYSLALKMLRDRQAAEEVTQDVFLAIWRGARDFDPARGSARAWILALAHHRSVDAVRRQRLRTTEPLPETAVMPGDVAEDAMQMVTDAEVRRALEGLSDGQREAIVYAYYGGYTQQEIAERLRVPLGTVKTRMRDGMQRLRTTLGPRLRGDDR